MGADGLNVLLGEALAAVERQARHLDHTRDGLPYPGSLDALDSPEVLERYEALTARFARLQDVNQAIADFADYERPCHLTAARRVASAAQKAALRALPAARQ